jgi:hypothetical protein
MIPTSALPPLWCRTTGEFASAKTAPPISALLATGPTSTAGTCVGADTGATIATRTDLGAAVGVELRAEISAARDPAMRIAASRRACGSAFRRSALIPASAPASRSGTLAVEPLPGRERVATGFAGGTVPAATARIRAGADVSNGVAGAKDGERGVGVNTAQPSAELPRAIRSSQPARLFRSSRRQRCRPTRAPTEATPIHEGLTKSAARRRATAMLRIIQSLHPLPFRRRGRVEGRPRDDDRQRG